MNTIKVGQHYCHSENHHAQRLQPCFSILAQAWQADTHTATTLVINDVKNKARQKGRKRRIKLINYDQNRKKEMKDQLSNLYVLSLSFSLVVFISGAQRHWNRKWRNDVWNWKHGCDDTKRRWWSSSAMVMVDRHCLLDKAKKEDFTQHQTGVVDIPEKS